MGVLVHGPLAQLAEQWTFNPLVVGSSPTRPTDGGGGETLRPAEERPTWFDRVGRSVVSRGRPAKGGGRSREERRSSRGAVGVSRHVATHGPPAGEQPDSSRCCGRGRPGGGDVKVELCCAPVHCRSQLPARPAGHVHQRGGGYVPHHRSQMGPSLAGRRRRGSARPFQRTPHRTPGAVEGRVCLLRNDRKLGPILGLPASTVHRVLVRHGLNRPSWLNRPTGEPIRRYKRDRPGELVHVDINNLGNIPDSGGWRTVGRTADDRNREATTARESSIPVIGFSYIHSAVDDHFRVAYSEVPAQRAPAHRHRLLATRECVLQRARHHRRAGTDRQRRLLQVQALRPRPGYGRHRPQESAPGVRRPTARSNASTARSLTSGATGGPTPRTTSGPRPWQPSSTPTTTTAATPHAGDTHSSAVSTTLRDNTHSPAHRTSGQLPSRVAVPRVGPIWTGGHRPTRLRTSAVRSASGAQLQWAALDCGARQ